MTYSSNIIIIIIIIIITITKQICTVSNSAISIEDFAGDWTKNELSFHNRDLITNISRRSHEW